MNMTTFRYKDKSFLTAQSALNQSVSDWVDETDRTTSSLEDLREYALYNQHICESYQNPCHWDVEEDGQWVHFSADEINEAFDALA